MAPGSFGSERSFVNGCTVPAALRPSRLGRGTSLLFLECTSLNFHEADRATEKIEITLLLYCSRLPFREQGVEELIRHR